MYERIIKLKQTNPNLKVLISIGGWFAKSTPFNLILTNDVTRNTFIQNVLNFLRHWNFDGLDIQWEYPGAIEYGATSDSKQRFSSLIKVFYLSANINTRILDIFSIKYIWFKYLNKAFKEEFKTSYKKYLLSAFVPSDESRIDAGYQVKLVCKFIY